MKRTVEWQGLILEIDTYCVRRENKEFDVRLIEGSWPNDKDLITLCDGGNPDMPFWALMHRGGEVCKGEAENIRTVIVYT